MNDKTKKKSNNAKIKVMIVEDSYIKQELLANILDSESEIEVIDRVGSGEQALLKLEKKKPDLITMDLNLPGMDGFEAAEKILFKYSIPIIIITSSRNKNNNEQLHKAMKESGSLCLLDSPPGLWNPDYEKHAKKIVRMVKLLSTTKMVTRHRRVDGKKNGAAISAESTDVPIEKIRTTKNDYSNINLIAIGVSTGGPTIVQQILSELPENYPLPILIVQHISTGFDKILASHLNNETSLKVKIAKDGEVVEGGTVYLTPGDKDMMLTKNNCLRIKKIDNNKILHPSVAVLFESVAVNCGKHALGLILTGMGADGAKELKIMRDKGAATIAQAKEGCVVFGMPKEAIRLGAANEILTPEEIIKTLIEIGESINN